MTRVLILVVLLAACEGKKSEPPDPCAPAIAHATSKISAQEMVRPKGEVEENADRAVQFEQAATASCREQHWPADVTSCLAKLDSRDIQPCWSTLPAAQRADLDEVLALYEHSKLDGCSRAAIHVVAHSKAAVDGVDGDAYAQRLADIERLGDAMKDACHDSAWSQDMIGCVLASPGTHGTDDCTAHLTDEQKAAWKQAQIAAASPQ